MLRFLKFRIAVFLLLFAAGAAHAAKPVAKVWPGEGEVSLGLNTPLFSKPGYERYPSLTLALEGRYNIEDVPAALGGGVGFHGVNWYSLEPSGDGCIDTMGECGFTIFAGGEYDFFRGRLISPYVGANTGIVYQFDRVRPYLQPKIGVEFFHAIRLGACVVLSSKNLSSFGLSLGIVIGGYPTK